MICLDNLASGLEANVSDLLGKANFKFIRHDITRPIFFDEDLDVVLHLASRASPFEFQQFPIQILKANTLGIWVALGIAKKTQGATSLHINVRDIRKCNGDSDVRRVHREREPHRSQKLL